MGRTSNAELQARQRSAGQHTRPASSGATTTTPQPRQLADRRGHTSSEPRAGNLVVTGTIIQ